MKKTRLTKSNPFKNFILTPILIIIYIGMFYLTYLCIRDYYGYTNLFWGIKYLVYAFWLLNILHLIGFLLAKFQVFRQKFWEHITNPYTYFRELPSDFGVGVTSILFDSTIENNKDIIAVLLDLCAKKYITLSKQNDKYIISVLKKPDTYLLYNERYILSSIINNNLKNLDYNVWYNHCLNDGINLNLFSYKKRENYFERLFKISDKSTFITIFIICLSMGFIAAILVVISSLTNTSDITNWQPIIISLLKFTALFTFILYILTFIIYIVFRLIFEFITFIIRLYLNAISSSYNKVLNNTLQKTTKGIREYQKLYSFRAFLKDFGNFADKYPEEIVLWDRYLSYAQVFGLTKEIMKTGYSKLVKNSSFQIDDINNITLDNIEIK